MNEIEQQTQYVTIEGESYEYLCEQMEYPYVQVGVIYIKFVVVDKHDFQPTHFLVVEQSKVVKRVFRYSDEHMRQLVAASKAANEYETARVAEAAKTTPTPEPVTTQVEGGDPNGMFL